MLIFGVTLFYVFRFFKKPKSLNKGTCILIIRLVDKKANLKIKGAMGKMGGRRDEKRGDVEKMDGKSVVNLQIPADAIENVDELVREGYYGNRSAAIRNIIRRGATYLRLRYTLPKRGKR